MQKAFRGLLSSNLKRWLKNLARQRPDRAYEYIHLLIENIALVHEKVPSEEARLSDTLVARLFARAEGPHEIYRRCHGLLQNADAADFDKLLDLVFPVLQQMKATGDTLEDYRLVQFLLDRLEEDESKEELEGRTNSAYAISNVYLDRMYSQARRALVRNLFWRHGPRYVNECAREIYQGLAPWGSVSGRSFLELGCGSHHPFGVSAALYINGVRQSLAVDISPMDAPDRSALALYDLLVDALAFPERWHWSQTSRETFFERIRRFDLEALQMGDLDRALDDVPLAYRVSDIYAPGFEAGKIELMSSWAVLEHFPDLPAAARQMYALMAPGGVGFHLVDLRDHRMYLDPGRFHEWSMLAEGDDWQGPAIEQGWAAGTVNRLRAQEVCDALQQAGFELLHFERRAQKPLPAGFETRMGEHFRRMPPEELETVEMTCTVRKPG